MIYEYLIKKDKENKNDDDKINGINDKLPLYD